MAKVTLLIVDDFEPWRAFLRQKLNNRPEFQIVGEANDGFGAWRLAEELQPDLILLDVGLPSLSGIDIARKIYRLSPKSRIVFVSENRSPEIVEQALADGAKGYVFKSEAEKLLLQTIDIALLGKMPEEPALAANEKAVIRQQSEFRHEVGFYSDDQKLLDDVTTFLAKALDSGAITVVIASAEHRANLLRRLRARSLNIDDLIEQKQFLLLDVTETISRFMTNGIPDPERFNQFVDNILEMATSETGSSPSLAVFGEGAHHLWMTGNIEAAIQLERLVNEISPVCPVHVFCTYLLDKGIDDDSLDLICGHHSTVQSRI